MRVNRHRYPIWAAVCMTVMGWSALGQIPAPATPDQPGSREIKTAGPRSSGPVSVSLQNELNAATDRGRAWLIAQQNADGSWGVSNRTRLTAVAALALTRDASWAERAAARRAARWQVSPTCTDAPACDMETAAWREIALQITMPADPTRTAVFLQCASAAERSNAVAPLACMLIREAACSRTSAPPRMASCACVAAGSGLPLSCARNMPLPDAAPGSNTNATPTLARLAAHWTEHGAPGDPALGMALPLWLVARFINRTGGGTLADAQGRVLDWRNDLAQTLVATQKVDERKPGTGFWYSETPDAGWAGQPIAETAFAILAMDEL